MKGFELVSETIITLYTRKRCPLCETVKDTLLELKEDWKFTLEEIDIAESDELTELYGLMIPVVHIDGEEVGFGYVDKMKINNYLQEKKQIL